MTQTPRPPIYKYLDIPEDEHFSQDRPSIVRACGGNYTRGKILGFLFGKASYIANKNGLSKEQAKVVTIFVEREEILEAIRISEPTYITHLNALKAYTYVGCPRYARGEYTVNFEAINKGIANPPEQIRRGRPKGTGKSLSNKRAKKASTSQENSSTSENTLTLPEIALTFIRENGLTLVPSGYLSGLEQKVKAISGEMEELQEKVKAISENPLNISGKVINIFTFQKYLELSLKYFKLLPPDEALLQAAQEAFSELLDYLDYNEIEESNSDAPFIASPTSSSFSSQNIPVTADTAMSMSDDATSPSTGQADVIPIAMGTMKPDGRPNEDVTSTPENVTQVSDVMDVHSANGYEKAPDEEDTPTVPRLGAIKIGDTHVLDTPPPLPAPGDAGGSSGISAPLLAAGRSRLPETHALTQQTPLLQATEPVLDGDASESTVTPPGAFPRLSHTLQDTSLLGDMPLDALLTQPQRRIDVNALLSQVRGQPTRIAQGERIPTETAPMKPASQNKTVEGKENKKVGSPEMPEDTALWNAETLVQVCEAYKGRRYPNGARKKSDRIRDAELAAAQTLLTQADDLWTENTGENRERLLEIIRHVQNRKGKWWLNNVEGGYVNPHHLVDKDRIHAMWDELHPKPTGNTSVVPINKRTLPLPTNVPPIADDLWYERLRTQQNMQGAAYR